TRATSQNGSSASARACAAGRPGGGARGRGWYTIRARIPGHLPPEDPGRVDVRPNRTRRDGTSVSRESRGHVCGRMTRPVATKAQDRRKVRLSRALGIPLTPKAARYIEKRP